MKSTFLQGLPYCFIFPKSTFQKILHICSLSLLQQGRELKNVMSSCFLTKDKRVLTYWFLARVQFIVQSVFNNILSLTYFSSRLCLVLSKFHLDLKANFHIWTCLLCIQVCKCEVCHASLVDFWHIRWSLLHGSFDLTDFTKYPRRGGSRNNENNVHSWSHFF